MGRYLMACGLASLWLTRRRSSRGSECGNKMQPIAGQKLATKGGSLPGRRGLVRFQQFHFALKSSKPPSRS